MIATATRRESSASATRRLLGVLIALWINMVVQPCAMAAEAEHDCPHCPPAHHEQMAGHHGHGAEKHARPCAALEAQCGDIGDISVESRGSAQPDDLDQPDALAARIIPEHAAVDRLVASRATGPPLLLSGTPPIYILNCAYLK